MSISLRRAQLVTSFKNFVCAVSVMASVQAVAQPASGIIMGKVRCGITDRPLFGVKISTDTLPIADTLPTSGRITSRADGSYQLRLSPGTRAVYFSAPGFLTRSFLEVVVRSGQTTQVDAVLFPMSAEELEVRMPAADADQVSGKEISSLTDRNGSQLLKRLNGVIVLDDPSTQNQVQSLNISGLGERYNQLLLNGSVFNNTDPLARSYPFSLIPAEAIEEVSVQKIADPSTPPDFAGGTLCITTRDMPERPFIYVQAEGGFSGETAGKEFYGDKRGSLEWLGFSGSGRNLPSEFPTTRSRAYFDQKNVQEQVSLARQLNNNLAPVSHGSSAPNSRILLGAGRSFRLKKGERIGLVAYLNHQRMERIDEADVQVSPDLAGNRFPFNDSAVLIRSHARDVRYRYASQLSAVANASILFGRSKVSFKNLLGSQFTGNYTRRMEVSKPDEDTLARAGIVSATTQRRFWNGQLTGEHALGKENTFRIDWHASYTYYRQQDPDERNFLLREEAALGNNYEIARQSDASLNSPDALLTNTSRNWRAFTDHSFTGDINISVPFRMFRQTQLLSGGVYLQSRNRTFRSDLLLIRGTGYYPLEELLDEERYYPGGLSVQNYYVRTDRRSNNGMITQSNRPNYEASSNIGASFIRLETRITNTLLLDWGIRLESNNHLVSGLQYEYLEGFRNPQSFPLDQNTRVTKNDLLPSAHLVFQPVGKWRMHVAYFTSVNRPQLQELALYRHYDATTFLVNTGNPLLANTIIDNIDAGITWGQAAGTYFSLSGFYKKMFQPIENVLSGYANTPGNLLVTPHNTPSAYVSGLQAAFRWNLAATGAANSWLSTFSLFGSGSWIRSKVEEGPIKSFSTPLVKEHTLTGTPGYTVNGGLVFRYPAWPSVTVLYNRTGDYISAVGSGAVYVLANGNPVTAIPHYRVRGSDRLDLQLSYSLFKQKLQLIAGVENLLGTDYTQYQDLNGNEEFDAPLSLVSRDGRPGYYESGTDNTVVSIEGQRTYYFRLAYLFK